MARLGMRIKVPLTSIHNSIQLEWPGPKKEAISALSLELFSFPPGWNLDELNKSSNN